MEFVAYFAKMTETGMSAEAAQQVIAGSNAERLTDTQSGVWALSDERKYIILGEDNIWEEMGREA